MPTAGTILQLGRTITVVSMLFHNVEGGRPMPSAKHSIDRRPPSALGTPEPSFFGTYR